MILKLALRELRNSKAYFLFSIFLLTIGLSGFVVLDFAKFTIESALNQNSKALLGADIAINTRIPLTDDELKQTQEFLKDRPTTILRDFFSMVAVEGRPPRLLQIRAIEDEYPYYGQIKLKSGAILNVGRELVSQNPSQIWVYPEVLAQLNLQVGDQLKIGDVFFVIRDAVVNDIGAVFTQGGLAPRVYMSFQDAKKTGLLQLGSTVTYTYLFQLMTNENTDDVIRELNLILTNPGYRIVSDKKSSEQSARFISYFSDYLGLVALVALGLSVLGSTFLTRTYLEKRILDLAILQSLGLPLSKSLRVFMVQSVIMGSIAAILSAVVGHLMLSGSVPYLQTYLMVPLQYSWNWGTPGTALLLAILVPLLAQIPLYQRLSALPTSLVFQESKQATLQFNLKKSIVGLLPLTIIFWVLAVWQAHSIKIGSIFVLGLLTSLLILSITSFGLVKLLGQVKYVSRLSWGFVFRTLSQNAASTSLGFTSISLGVVLLILLPVLKDSLLSEISRPDGTQLPSLFFFDIQDEQVAEFKEFAKSQNVPISNLAPMVRAKLEKVNSEQFAKVDINEDSLTREDEQAARSKNRSYNLSYARQLKESETIVKGREFSTRPSEGNNKFEISVEERFASRLGVDVGDWLTFDVLGVPVEGEIVNLRKVRWSSFQPNFFVVFSPGALEAAPKTYLANLLPVTDEVKNNFQMKLVEKFPNISVIDVTRVIDQILGIVDIIGIALTAIASLSFIVGAFILVSLAVFQFELRKRDLVLLRLLGASYSSLRGLQFREVIVLGGVGVLLGTTLGLVLAYLVSLQLFDGWFDPNWARVLGLSISLMLLVVVVGLLSGERLLRTSKTPRPDEVF